MNNLRLGSLFDGSGGFALASMLEGVTPVWASEIEPFPIRVTTKRIPHMKHYGDICRVDGRKVEPVDIITFGSPCTDLSVAGQRAGLEGSKSVLFYEAIRIIKEMRENTYGKCPRYIVWENVPGAFSSNKGEDFQSVLEEIAKIEDKTASVPMPPKGKWLTAGWIVGDGYSIAWRTLDAQYWGVPQRRRRIFLVADFGGECAGEILFKSESLRGDTSESGGEGQGATPHAAQSTPKTICSAGFCPEQGEKTRGVGYSDEQSPTLRAGVTPAVIAFEPGALVRLGHQPSEELSSTLRAQMGDNQVCVALDHHPADSRLNISEDGKVQTLTGRMGTGGGNVPMVMNEQRVFENHSQDTRYVGPLEVAQTVSATYGMGGNNQPFVVGEQKAYGICSDGSNSMKSDNPHSGIYEADTSRTLDAKGGNPACNQGGIAIVEESCAYSFDPYNNKQDDVMPSIGTNCGMSTGRSICLQGSMIGRAEANGPQGDGVNEDVSFTLNTVDKHAVVYALDRESFNSGQRFAQSLGVRDEGIASTLNAQGPSAVAMPTFSMTTGSFTQINEEKAPTLAARDYKDPLSLTTPMVLITRFGG